jgi:hypothetical protein
MSTDPKDGDGVRGEPDEKTRLALEIHQRLMREHNLQFYNRSEPAPAAPPEPRRPADDGGDAR